jgi:hypothetical protein
MRWLEFCAMRLQKRLFVGDVANSRDEQQPPDTETHDSQNREQRYHNTRPDRTGAEALIVLQKV